MKTCSRCNISKSSDSFRFRNKTKGTLAPWCKPCFSAYEKNKWAGDPERRKSNISANKARKLRNQQYIWDYLLAHPCMTCGEADPIVLEFDHREPEHKSYNVSEGASFSLSIENIESEIAKCDVLCANCHRRKTAKQFGWNKKMVGVVRIELT